MSPLSRDTAPHLPKTELNPVASGRAGISCALRGKIFDMDFDINKRSINKIRSRLPATFIELISNLMHSRVAWSIMFH